VLYCYWVICFEMKDRFEAKGMKVSLEVLTALGFDDTCILPNLDDLEGDSSRQLKSGRDGSESRCYC